MRIFTPLLLAGSLAATGVSLAADATAAAPLRKVAIIVENHAGAQFNDKVAVLEDMLSSRIAGEGYSVISRSVTISALKSYDSAGIAVSSQAAANAIADSASARRAASAIAGQADAAQSTAIGAAAAYGTATNTAAVDVARNDSAQISGSQASADQSSGHSSAALNLARSGSAQVAVTPGTTPLDQALSDNTSALRLAQTMGADYILIPTITSYGTDKRSYTGDGIATVNVIHKLRVSYKIVEAGAGGEIKGAMVTASKTIRESANLQVDNSDVINDLLDDAAEQLAVAIVQSANTLPATVAKDKWWASASPVR